MTKTAIKDNGGRRLGKDRRQVTSSTHYPERRSSQDRRSGADRRGDRYKNRGTIERRNLF